METIAVYCENHRKPRSHSGKLQSSSIQTNSIHGKHCALFVFFFFFDRLGPLDASVLWWTAYTAIPYSSKREYIHPKMLVNYTDKLAPESEDTLKMKSTSHVLRFPGCTMCSMPASSHEVISATIMAARWRIFKTLHCAARRMKKPE
jgi:hypothetical protein